MDTTKAVTHVGLCAGYGGIELGLKRAIPNMRTIALCEVEAFAVANLVSKMEAGQLEPAPIWPNLKTFPWQSFRGCVDILTGGYPCQPFSAVGRRAGSTDERHLWPYIEDGIASIKPRLCFFENVEGHISMGLSTVISGMEELGYRVSWGIFSASEVGAPHQRKRVFILAHRIGTGLEGLLPDTGAQGREAARRSSAGCSQDSREWRKATGRAARPGQEQYQWEAPRVLGKRKQTQSPLGGNTDGSASGLDYAKLCESCDNRTDELRLLGNGVVPATSEKAFRVLLEKLQHNTQ